MIKWVRKKKKKERKYIQWFKLCFYLLDDFTSFSKFMKIYNSIQNMLRIIINIRILNNSHHELEAHKNTENWIYVLRLSGHYFFFIIYENFKK